MNRFNTYMACHTFIGEMGVAVHFNLRHASQGDYSFLCNREFASNAPSASPDCHNPTSPTNVETSASLGGTQASNEILKWRIQVRVECEVGDKGPRAPDFALIDRFRRGGLSSKAMLEMLSELADKNTKRVE